MKDAFFKRPAELSGFFIRKAADRAEKLIIN